jgi:hypothetical protein
MKKLICQEISTFCLLVDHNLLDPYVILKGLLNSCLELSLYNLSNIISKYRFIKYKVIERQQKHVTQHIMFVG